MPDKEQTKDVPLSYHVPESVVVPSLIKQVERLKSTYDQFREEQPHKQGVIQEKLRALWTYHSNAIEGNRLTEGDTIFFLKEGLTVKGKPLKDFLETKNHAQAIDYLWEIIADKRPLNESLIRELNALIMLGIEHTPAIDPAGRSIKKPATPGQYKTQPNHVLQLDGTIHNYIDPLQVPQEMEQLIKWIKQNEEKLSPVIVSAIAHYNMVRIHPFDDGNGRGARILMNLILMRGGYPPAIIKVENREDYIQSIREADNGDLSSFVSFITESLIETLEQITSDIQN